MNFRDLKIWVTAVKTGKMPMFIKYNKTIPADEWLDILEKKNKKRDDENECKETK